MNGWLAKVGWLAQRPILGRARLHFYFEAGSAGTAHRQSH